MFGFATVMMLLSGAMQWPARSLPCPTDQALAARCASMRKSAARVYPGAVCLYLIGPFFAFIAPLL
ncbi:hypothetical protein F2P44_13015 [Massilia sp. CCM 8695]|uniref:Uncharacterized protein n=1 Tax=Massilia frigida TaxID=2609281 RepID=A0ABX0N745_9BURK|nr:hypothetical protein [Massilia frigida]NHZ80188.1 hypothetical protein [Massilia frigida]